MSNDDIHICTSFDTSMAVPVGVLAHSIMQNHKGNRILHLHLLHCRDVDTRSVEKILPNKSDRFVLKFHEVDETGLSRIPLARFPRAAFFRLLIEHYVDANRVLFLDADTLVLRDVSALFDIDQEGFCIAAAQDYVITDIFPRGEAQFDGRTVLYRDYVEKCIGVNNADDYINSGIMLIDMNLWKQKQISKRALEYCESMPPLVFADQDAINWCINGNVLKIDCRWNALVNFSDRIRNPITDAQKIRDIWYRQPWIAHFAGYNKPWKPNDRLTVHDAMYRSMASKSACAGIFWSEYNGLVANLPKKQQIRARTLFARYLMRKLKTAGGSAFRNLIEKTPNRLQNRSDDTI